MPAEAHNVPVFKGGQFLVARFDCPPACPAWSSENRISGGVVLAFPRAPVGIRHEGGRRLVADRTSVMLYNPGQRYRRELLDVRTPAPTRRPTAGRSPSTPARTGASSARSPAPPAGTSSALTAWASAT